MKLSEPKDDESSGFNLIAAYATFNYKGDKIFAGTSKGAILVYDSSSLQVLYTFKIPGGALIKQIAFSFNGKQFLVNSSDQRIRLFDEDGRSPLREFQDPVNKTQWQKCCFSWDNDAVVGGSTKHTIYIWNSETGGLYKTLEGTKDNLIDMSWNPTRPALVSIGSTGCVYIWACVFAESWSAFQPGFKELEENEEYIEREDEFDEIDVPLQPKEKKRRIEEDVQEEIDILTVQKYFSDEDENELLFLPTDIPPHTNDDE